MNMWCHLPTGFKNRHALLYALLVVLIVVFTTSILFNGIAHAAQDTNKTINFQGRLLRASGAVVPDGNYNLQFRIYQDGTGSAAGNPNGSLRWTESHINNNTGSGVKVKNGYFSVTLGSRTTFGSSIDWNQDTLWLSMNVAGSSNACTSFGGGSCVADGEMLPMKRLTATPYSINSGAVGGKTIDELVQLGQGVQTDNGDGSSLFVNKTGTGNLVQLQSNGTDSFTVNNAGSLTMGSAADQSISVTTATSGEGKSLTIKAGDAAAGSELGGGDIVLQAGEGDGAASSGNVIVRANDNSSTGTFQVQNSNGDAVLNVNTQSGRVSVGSLAFVPAIEDSEATYSLWDENDAYGTAYDDGTGVNLGTIFKSDTPGVVTGVKFYSPAGGNANGTDIGKLWSCVSQNCTGAQGGTELANVTFTESNTSEGWKSAEFSSPVRIEPGINYIVTYYTSTGVYHAAPNYFATAHNRAPLTAPSNIDTPNGVYVDASTGFPTTTFGKTSYWVDVTFQPDDFTYDQISSDNGLIIASNGGLTLGSAASAAKVQGSTVAIEGTDSVSLHGNGVSVLTAKNIGGQASVGIGNSGSANNALDVTGNINSSGEYRIDGQTALTDSSLTFNGDAPSSVTSADGQSLTIDGKAGVAIESNGETSATFNSSNVKIGSDSGQPTLLTLDTSSTAPTGLDEALLGSMYYDTALGKVQCYEQAGWGACGASPDTFVSLSPEYANAVMNGADIGTISSDLCSDELNINDGSSAQPTICNTDETYNFYKWTSAESTAQIRSIYVTYQLPANFKEFVAGSTSLMGRTDGANANVNYQVYRDSDDDGLISCGSAIPVSTGASSAWQTASATGGSDPSTCGFEPGDSMLLRVNLAAHGNANAFVSNLKFTYSNN